MASGDSNTSTSRAPAFLSIACSTALTEALSTQTWRDWRIADATGLASRPGGLAALRDGIGGALLVSCDDALLGRALQQDQHLLDKLTRIMAEHAPKLVWLATTTDAGCAYPGFIARPGESGDLPPVRGVGFVLTAVALDMVGRGPTAAADSVDAVVHAARKIEADRILTVLVGPSEYGRGFALPRAARAPARPILEVAREQLRGAARTVARRISLELRLTIGESAHQRLRHIPVARLLRRASGAGAKPEARPAASPVKTGLAPREPADTSFSVGPGSAASSPAWDGPGLLIAAPWVVLGGADRALLDFLHGLSELAPNVRKYLVTTEPMRMAWSGEALAKLDGVFSIPDHAPRDPFGFLQELVGRFGIDAYLVSNSTLGFDAIPAVKAAGRNVRVATQLHGFEIDHETGALTGPPVYAARNYDALIDQYVTISRTVAERLTTRVGVAPSKVRTIYLGIDVARFAACRRRRFDGERLNVLWLGRLSEEKDPLLALRLADAFRRRVGARRFHLTMAGGGPLDVLVRRACKRMNLRGVVDVVGSMPDPLPLLEVADALLMTSRFEGIPVVIYEAMAAGMPVVAPTPNTSIEEVLGDADAFLIRDRENVAEYLSGLDQLLSHPDAARRRSERMLALADRFSLERYAREMYEALFPDAARAAAPRSKPARGA